MKLSQKVKYVGYGVIGTIVAIPLAIKAVETIPLTFNEGDIISASVINTLLQRVNDTQRGFSSVDELNGTWSCTVYDTGSPVGVDQCTDNGSLLRSKTGNLTFDSTNKTWIWSGDGSLNDCGTGRRSSGNYDVKAGILITDIGVYDARKQSPNEFVWFITNSMPPSGFNHCIKTSTAPAPVNNLTATVINLGVELSWTDNSINETGFEVQYKTSVTGDWIMSTITPANTTSSTVSSLSSGTYWFRVIAKNSIGDSISSSEVQAIVE